jgi:hypothetical protein
MTPGKLNKMWWKRLRKLDKVGEERGWTAEQATEHRIISEFLVDIEFLHVEETDQDRENRELITQVADQIRKNHTKITL